MSDEKTPEERRYAFRDLNPLGKTIFLTGAAVRGAGTLLERAIDRAAEVAVETERAFREGRDPNIDDANVLDEKEDGPR